MASMFPLQNAAKRRVRPRPIEDTSMQRRRPRPIEANSFENALGRGQGNKFGILKKLALLQALPRQPKRGQRELPALRMPTRNPGDFDQDPRFGVSIPRYDLSVSRQGMPEEEGEQRLPMRPIPELQEDFTQQLERPMGIPPIMGMERGLPPEFDEMESLREAAQRRLPKRTLQRRQLPQLPRY